MKNLSLLPGALALVAAVGFVQLSDGKGGLGASSLASAVVADAHAQDAAAAVVNGVTIPASRVDLYLGGQQVTEADRQTIVDNIITSELILQAAKEKGIADSARVQDELAIAEYTIIGRAYVENFFAGKEVDEAKINARYEEISEQIKEQGEYDVSHILVADEALANDLLKQLQDDPRKFADLAAEHSQDPGSQPNGGNLGWVSPSALVLEFSQAVSQLSAGEIAPAPVRTQFGWHIIRVDGQREATPPPLNAEMRQTIEQTERAELFNEHIEELRASANVERP